MLITAPTFRFRNIEWTLDRPAQINVDLSGKRTIGTPLYGKWSAKVDLATYESEALFRSIRSFLVRCFGPVNTFQLPATVEVQNGNSGVTAGATAAPGSITMSLSGAATPMLAGQYVTVNDQMLVLVEDQSGSTILFEPPLRVEATSGVDVETANPYALVHLADEQVGWMIDPPQRFSASFSVEEAI